MAKNGYEIRLELLQLAESRLRDRYYEAKERFQYLDEKGETALLSTSLNDQYPVYPTDAEIDALAQHLIATMSGQNNEKS
tara:strand:- start:207 stop:446 length:240 start_codon:yes stop_codon:yes gene_type:complete